MPADPRSDGGRTLVWTVLDARYEDPCSPVLLLQPPRTAELQALLAVTVTHCLERVETGELPRYSRRVDALRTLNSTISPETA